MAVAYAAIANGGRVLRPRLGLRIEDATGRALQQLDAPTARRVKISAENRAARSSRASTARRARRAARRRPVFEGFPIPIAGKTGTAEHVGKADQSWYVALAPYPNPRYVVAVTDEARRLRRRHRGADGAPHPGRAASTSRRPAWCRAEGRPTDAAPRPPPPSRTSATTRARACCASTR